MKEIRVHGRGGQGAVTSTQLLAIAGFLDGKQTQAFPNFGVERTGAPVESYARISSKKIHLRQHVYEPDYVIVLDSTLLDTGNAAKGLKQGGAIFINTDKAPNELKLNTKAKVFTADITRHALDIIGKPFVNIGALGLFSAKTGEVSLESMKKAVLQELSEKKALAEKNNKLLEKIFRECSK